MLSAAHRIASSVTRYTRFSANTTPGVSSHPDEKPDFRPARIRICLVWIDAARSAISQTLTFRSPVNRRPFIGHTLRKLPVLHGNLSLHRTSSFYSILHFHRFVNRFSKKYRKFLAFFVNFLFVSFHPFQMFIFV